MSREGKVCDAADWFGPDLPRLIRSELREPPRFHRKQWEFAMILAALHADGVLRPGRRGLSMGGGRERLLYAVAPQVDRLVVTDLYGSGSGWEDARTDDPRDFIEAHMPFPVDSARIEALAMDMRQLDFGSESFDFCYSSCAIEHIGSRNDFLTHLKEVHRVLKDGGVYALTTEFHYGARTIELPGNYLFSGAYLSDLIAESPLAVAPGFDASLARHRANVPLPANLPAFGLAKDAATRRLREELPHLQLLRGACPFTSALFVLKKAAPAQRPGPMEFHGLADSREFLAEGIDELRTWLETTTIALEPFALLPEGPSTATVAAGDDTVFHSDYVWLGSGPRIFVVALTASVTNVETATLELRVHRIRASGPFDAQCVAAIDVVIPPGNPVTRELAVGLDDDSCYAVLGKMRKGSCLLKGVEVLSRPSADSAP